jgi:hypothetical protein
VTRHRHRLAPAAVVALSVALGAGCSFDWSPVDRAGMRDCLQAGGERVGSPPRGVAGLTRLARADGVEALLAVRRVGDVQRRPWAVLAFFDGAERAEAAAERRLAAPLRSTRRQNVVAVFGRSDRFGRAPTGAEERRLQHCFDRAST